MELNAFPHRGKQKRTLWVKESITLQFPPPPDPVHQLQVQSRPVTMRRDQKSAT